MRKLLISIIIIFISILTSCYQEKMVLLPDLTGKNQAEIKTILTDLKIKYDFIIKRQIYLDESEYDTFIEYGQNLQAGDRIKSTQHIYVYTSVLPLTLNRLDEVKLELEYIGKSYLDDNIGVVTLLRTIDGDTADFIDIMTNTSIRVRFLGIDTPESTSKKEPWGKAASDYTAQRLREANQIILLGEGSKQDTYGRYLAWIWVDGQLLNLDIVQQAYSSAKVSSSSSYFQIFNEVERTIALTGRRIWGEIDPYFR